MSSGEYSPIITVTNTEFYTLVQEARQGVTIDCLRRRYEISCPSCARSFRTNEARDIFLCPFCGFEDVLFDWRPDRIAKDGPALRPIGWKTADISED